MKAKLVIMGDDGTQYEGELTLLPLGRVSSRPVTGGAKSLRVASVDFEVNERAFAKKHAKGLSGPKKFALVIAYLAKGDPKKEIPLKAVEKVWNRMTALLGGRFNRFYSNKAKENGWVNSTKNGMYALRPEWREILEQAVPKK